MKKRDAVIYIAFAAVCMLIVGVSSPYIQSISMNILIGMLLATSFNLLFGYTGMLSFGQPLFFGTGAYAFALIIIKGGASIIFSIFSATLVSALAAALTGFLIIRVASHYFVIMTVVLALIPFYLSNHLSDFTGGDDGIPLSLPEKLLMQAPLMTYNLTHMYWFLSVIVMLALACVIKVLLTGFGLSLKAVRENEFKAASLGYNTGMIKYTAWVIAGMLTGLAGALYVLAFKYVSSSMFDWALSAGPMTWAVVGGGGTIGGPLIGTVFLIMAKDILSSNAAYYPLLIGLLLICIMHTNIKGLAGWWKGVDRDSAKKDTADIKIEEDVFRQTGFAETPKIEEKEILQVEDCKVSFGPDQVISGVSFCLDDQEVRVQVKTEKGNNWQTYTSPADKKAAIAFVGPNGAGKTTLLNLLSGRYRHAEGSLRFLGEEMLGSSLIPWKLMEKQRNMVKQGLVSVFQHAEVFPDLTVSENIMIAMQAGMRIRKLFFSNPGGVGSKERLGAILKQMGLWPERDQKAVSLSYGRKKMLEIGMGLACRGRLLLLDEPTAGVSPAEVDLIVDLLNQISRSCSLLIIEHDLAVVKKLGFVTCFMADGQIIAAGRPEELLGNSQIMERFL